MDQADLATSRGPMRLLTPCLHISSVYDLPFAWLKEKSVSAIITDLDNTLVPWRDYRVADDLTKWFSSLRIAGFRCVILTNARPSPTVAMLGEQLSTPIIPGARKPIQRFFREALQVVEAPPNEACVVGDQVFTDILGGNLMGCHTVLVDKIGKREFFGTRIVRVVERMALRAIRKRGYLNSEPPLRRN